MHGGCMVARKYEDAIRNSGPTSPEARGHRRPCLRAGRFLSLYALRADLAAERREEQRPPRAAGNVPSRRPAGAISAAFRLGARLDGVLRVAVDVSDHRCRVPGGLAEIAVVRGPAIP